MVDDERHDLYKQYYQRVVSYLVKKWNFTSEDARDLAQDVFVSVFRHMAHGSIIAMWPFIKTTAHHRAVNAIRSRSVHRKSEAGSLEALPELSAAVLRDIWTDQPPPTPEMEAIGNERAGQLRDAIAGLSPSLRSCVLLRMRGKPYEEIAAILGITVNAVKTRLRDAKKLLIARLGPGGDHGQ
jgi:RNA polymerase sigma-70 factor (ECF subfamily)